MLIVSSTGTLFANPPRAAVAPITIFGNTSEAQKKIIFNRFESLLSRFYRLYSQSQFKKAKEVVFESLAIDECTETYCIRKIQETLQVERLFFLEITNVEDVAQLKITLVHDDESFLEEGICSGCTIEMLYERIGDLVQKIVSADLGAAAVSDKAFVSVQESPAAKESDSLFVWHITATGFALLASWHSVRAADTYNQLAEENSAIEVKTDNALSQTQYDELNKTYDDNLEKMQDQKEMIRLLDAVTVACIAWEIYLLYRETRHTPEAELALRKRNQPFHISVQNKNHEQKIQLSFRSTW